MENMDRLKYLFQFTLLIVYLKVCDLTINLMQLNIQCKISSSFDLI